VAARLELANDTRVIRERCIMDKALDIQLDIQLDDPGLTTIRWEACEAFLSADASEICACCGWLADDHHEMIATITRFPLARPARIRKAS